MNEEIIRSGLHVPCEVILFDEIDSTNDEIKRRIPGFAGSYVAVVSDRQTAGRGRMGRSFFSPAGSGIYLSVLLPAVDFFSEERPEAGISGLTVTCRAAVCVSRAIRTVCHKETQIKWVNDLFLDGKKCCGILAEALTDPSGDYKESGTACRGATNGGEESYGGITHVVVGIGINVYRPAEMPEELRDIMGYIWDETEHRPGMRDRLVSSVIDELIGGGGSVMEEYRRRSNVLGKQIRYGIPREDGSPGPDWMTGTAVAVDDHGGLVVEKEDKTVEILRSGEISVRSLP